MNIIELKPGIHQNRIRKTLGISRVQLLDCLQQLVNEGRINYFYHDGKKKFIPANISPDSVRNGEDLARRLIDTVQKQSGITQTELAAQLHLSKQLVNYHILKLSKKGIIIREDKRRGIGLYLSRGIEETE